MNDLVNRRNAIDLIQNAGKIGKQTCIGILKLMPSAQPERKKGKWIYKHFVWFCSECGNSPTKGMGYVQGHDELYDFCPHCGADMRERKEE